MADTTLTLENLHIGTILVMLPFDADKVAAMDVGFKVNGKDASDIDPETIKAGDTVSFLNHCGDEVEFELLAMKSNSDGHDLAAFMNVDTGDIVLTYPGMNDPISDFGDGVVDKLCDSSLNKDFVKSFNADELMPALERNIVSVQAHDFLLVSHSSGDAEHAYAALDLKNWHGIEGSNLFINPWDISDSVKISLADSVTRDLNPHDQAPDIECRVMAEYTYLYDTATTVFGYTEGWDGVQKGQVLNAMLDDSQLFHSTLRMEAGHTAKDFVNLTEDNIRIQSSDTDAQVLDDVLKNARKSVEEELKNSDESNLQNGIKEQDFGQTDVATSTFSLR